MNLFFLTAFLFPIASFAFADLFSQNQCPYNQQPFPTDPQDQQRGQDARIRELKEARSRAEQHMPQMDDELRRLRGNLYYYFKRPWADSMVRHMDNGYDCCQASTVTASIATPPSFDRKPAGSDVSETTDYQPLDPTQSYDEPTQETIPQETTSGGSSCGGYPADYCQPVWGQNESPSTGGRLCLETGFESSPAWYGAACRGGGTQMITSSACVS
ncbi:hypothetical protein K2X05_00600 [bacterium]|nr:hypothetical protein [bacterium]